MSFFTTEAAVRLKFQVSDASWASPTLVEESIAHAHMEILPALNVSTPLEPPPAEVALGETLLAGAHLLRSLASGEGSRQKEVVIGGQRIDMGKRFAALIALSERAEAEAWHALTPYLAAEPSQAMARATDSTPVLGGQ